MLTAFVVETSLRLDTSLSQVFNRCSLAKEQANLTSAGDFVTGLLDTVAID